MSSDAARARDRGARTVAFHLALAEIENTLIPLYERKRAYNGRILTFDDPGFEKFADLSEKIEVYEARRAATKEDFERREAAFEAEARAATQGLFDARQRGIDTLDREREAAFQAIVPVIRANGATEFDQEREIAMRRAALDFMKGSDPQDVDVNVKLSDFIRDYKSKQAKADDQAEMERAKELIASAEADARQLAYTDYSRFKGSLRPGISDSSAAMHLAFWFSRQFDLLYAHRSKFVGVSASDLPAVVTAVTGTEASHTEMPLLLRMVRIIASDTAAPSPKSYTECFKSAIAASDMSLSFGVRVKRTLRTVPSVSVAQPSAISYIATDTTVFKEYLQGILKQAPSAEVSLLMEAHFVGLSSLRNTFGSYTGFLDRQNVLYDSLNIGALRNMRNDMLGVEASTVHAESPNSYELGHIRKDISLASLPVDIVDVVRFTTGVAKLRFALCMRLFLKYRQKVLPDQKLRIPSPDNWDGPEVDVYNAFLSKSVQSGGAFVPITLDEFARTGVKMTPVLSAAELGHMCDVLCAVVRIGPSFDYLELNELQFMQHIPTFTWLALGSEFKISWENTRNRTLSIPFVITPGFVTKLIDVTDGLCKRGRLAEIQSIVRGRLCVDDDVIRESVDIFMLLRDLALYYNFLRPPSKRPVLGPPYYIDVVLPEMPQVETGAVLKTLTKLVELTHLCVGVRVADVIEYSTVNGSRPFFLIDRPAECEFVLGGEPDHAMTHGSFIHRSTDERLWITPHASFKTSVTLLSSFRHLWSNPMFVGFFMRWSTLALFGVCPIPFYCLDKHAYTRECLRWDDVNVRFFSADISNNTMNAAVFGAVRVFNRMNDVKLNALAIPAICCNSGDNTAVLVQAAFARGVGYGRVELTDVNRASVLTAVRTYVDTMSIVVVPIIVGVITGCFFFMPTTKKAVLFVVPPPSESSTVSLQRRINRKKELVEEYKLLKATVGAKSDRQAAINIAARRIKTEIRDIDYASTHDQGASDVPGNLSAVFSLAYAIRACFSPAQWTFDFMTSKSSRQRFDTDSKRIVVERVFTVLRGSDTDVSGVNLEGVKTKSSAGRRADQSKAKREFEFGVLALSLAPADSILNHGISVNDLLAYRESDTPVLACDYLRMSGNPLDALIHREPVPLVRHGGLGIAMVSQIAGAVHAIAEIVDAVAELDVIIGDNPEAKKAVLTIANGACKTAGFCGFFLLGAAESITGKRRRGEFEGREINDALVPTEYLGLPTGQPPPSFDALVAAQTTRALAGRTDTLDNSMFEVDEEELHAHNYEIRLQAQLAEQKARDAAGSRTPPLEDSDDDADGKGLFGGAGEPVTPPLPYSTDSDSTPPLPYSPDPLEDVYDADTVSVASEEGDAHYTVEEMMYAGSLYALAVRSSFAGFLEHSTNGGEVTPTMLGILELNAGYLFDSYAPDSELVQQYTTDALEGAAADRFIGTTASTFWLLSRILAVQTDDTSIATHTDLMTMAGHANSVRATLELPEDANADVYFDDTWFNPPP
jgi:hypothetical protein